MDSDDLTFFGTLVMCIALGNFYKRIENTAAKKNYGTGVGMIVVCLICGPCPYHCLLMTAGNIVIITCCERRYMHQLSLVYSWIYLLYLHFDGSMSRYAINIHQMLALRLVGLASELNTSEYLMQQSLGGVLTLTTSKYMMEVDILSSEPKAVDIFHYAFNFVGIQKGPYYRWQTFNDYFSLPFGILGDCSVITARKLKKMPIYLLIYMYLRANYPPHAYEESDFYWKKGPDYRFLYNIPQLALYVISSQMVSLLCTSVCSEAGFVIYPAKCNPQPGMGPTENFNLLNLASRNSNLALAQDYNFSTIKTFDNSRIVMGPTMRKTLRSWDMPVQYWFWAHIYRKVNHPSRVVKNALSFAVWSVWCGPSVNQLILAPTLWIYINLEDFYSDLCKKYTIGSERRVWNICFSIMRLLCLIYLTPCLVLSDTLIVGYYNSIYWAFHLITLVVAALAYVIARTRHNFRLFNFNSYLRIA